MMELLFIKSLLYAGHYAKHFTNFNLRNSVK